MKILVWADACTHSGFAQVTHNLFEKLVTKHGHDVSVLGINARGDYWDTPLKVYRADMLDPKDIYGASRIVEMVAKVMPDAIVMLNDQSMALNLLLDNKHDPERVLWRGMKVGDFAYKPPIIGYLTADGYESPRSWGTLKERVTRVAMSHFGQQQMPEAPVIWHGVDTSVYHPQDRREAKRKLGYDPDRFLILRTDKNSTRKDYPSTWKALRPVLRRHPDIDVHFHCLPRTGECDLRAAMWNDEDIRDRVNFSPNLGGYTGWDEDKLALLMAAADLHVSTSWGEGFGLNLLQSLACGTPVIAQDCSAITEVVGPGGTLIKPRARITVPQGQEQCLPDIEKFSYWIEHLYGARKARERLGEAAVAHAQGFSWDIAADKFNTLITEAVAKAAT